MSSSNDTDLIAKFDRAVRDQPIAAYPWKITPALAAHILETYNKGGGNRQPHGRRYDYQEKINGGGWVLTGQTIIMSSKATLLDGQNRLMACVAAGSPFECYIVFGISDPNAYAAIDDGKKRSPGDTLHSKSALNANACAAALRWIVLIETNRAKTRKSFSNIDTAEAHEAHDKDLLQKSIKIASKLQRAYPQDRVPVKLVAPFHYVASKADPKLAIEFFDAWIIGNLSGRFSPIDKMTRKVREMKAVPGVRINEVTRMAYLFIAWNLVFEKRAGTLKSFDWELSDSFPVMSGYGGA